VPRKLAIVLGGGGARGALQVGALRALFESGYTPDLLVGTSIGAVNAAFLAVHGPNPEGVAALVEAWHDAARADLLPANYLWLAVRSLFNRPVNDPYHRMRDFFIAHGLAEDTRFADIQGVRLALVASDLSHGCPMIYGEDLQQRVLEGLLASTALPPWVHPLEQSGHVLLDGGVVSTLPVEPAMRLGAGKIIALDLIDRRGTAGDNNRLGLLMGRMIFSVEQRTSDLECALAEARHIPLRRINLGWQEPIPVWDFSHTDELIEQGYELALREIAAWQPPRRTWWARWRGGSSPRSI
jgi:NTE family protein